MGAMLDVASRTDARIESAANRVETLKSSTETRQDLQHFQQVVCRYGVQLLALHDGNMAGLLRGIVETVGAAAPKVLVVGQDGAGKTSLINRLIGRTGFLPAGPTGSTLAVTCLHFSPPAGPRRGAKVTFVSRDELRTRRTAWSLKQRLTTTILDDDPALDQHQARMLGTSREWSSEVRDTAELAQYIAGVPNQQSDLVKSVDLYFDSSPFAHAITFVDTPAFALSRGGTARAREIDAHIDEVDVCIVVLGHVGAASDIDIGPELLSVLRRVPKDRIVVYVNFGTTRAAEVGAKLQGGEREVQVKVLERLLRQKLHQNVTVITGDQEMPPGAVNGTIASGLSAKAGTLLSAIRFLEPQGVAVDTDRAVSALVNEIARRIGNGPYARQIADAAGVLRDVAESCEAAARSNAIAVSNRILDLQHDRVTKERTLQHVERLIDDIRQLCVGIDKSCSVATAAVKSAQEEGERELRELLDRQLKSFLAERGGELRAALRNHQEDTWRCDTVDWRRELELEAAVLSGNLRVKLFEILRQTVEDLRQAIEAAMPDVLADVEAIKPVPNFRLPSFEIPIDPIAVKLEKGGWGGWLKSRPTPAKVLNDFKKLVTDEFEKTTRITSEQMSRGFSKDGATVLYRISQKSVTIIGLMIERREQLVKTADNLIALRNEGMAERLLTVHALEQEQAKRVTSSASQIKYGLDEVMRSVSETCIDAQMVLSTSAAPQPH